jgi:hypothetical protein
MSLLLLNRSAARFDAVATEDFSSSLLSWNAAMPVSYHHSVGFVSPQLSRSGSNGSDIPTIEKRHGAVSCDLALIRLNAGRSVDAKTHLTRRNRPVVRACRVHAAHPDRAHPSSPSRQTAFAVRGLVGLGHQAVSVPSARPISSRKRWPPVIFSARDFTRVITRRSIVRVMPT